MYTKLLDYILQALEADISSIEIVAIEILKKTFSNQKFLKLILK